MTFGANRIPRKTTRTRPPTKSPRQVEQSRLLQRLGTTAATIANCKNLLREFDTQLPRLEKLALADGIDTLKLIESYIRADMKTVSERIRAIPSQRARELARIAKLESMMKEKQDA